MSKRVQQAMRMARVTTKGQVTIPVEIRDGFGIRAGDTLLFEPSGTESISFRVLHQRQLSDLSGILSTDREFPDKEVIREEVGRALGERLKEQK